MQTYNPDNPILQFAINYDYQGFFNREKALRKSTGFPPYTLVLRVMIEGDEDSATIETLKNAYMKIKAIHDKNADNFLFFNKMRCPVKRIKNKFRYEILMRLRGDYDKVRDEIYNAALSEKTAETLVYVEENPSNLY